MWPARGTVGDMGIFDKQSWVDSIRRSPQDFVVGGLFALAMTTLAKIIGVPTLDNLGSLTGLAYVLLFFLICFLTTALVALWRWARGDLVLPNWRGAASPNNDLDNTIEFEWNPFIGEITNPPHSHYCHVTLSPTPVDMIGGGGSPVAIGPGTKVYFRDAFQCKVTNHSKVPVFNVNFELQCVFTAVVHDAKPSAIITGPAGAQLTIMGQGDEIMRRPWRIYTAKINAGAEHPFVFYIDNPNDVWIDVTVPETIEFTRLGSSQRETARFIMPNRKRTIFPPRIEMGKRTPETTKS